jgi:hypothetical protein
MKKPRVSLKKSRSNAAKRTQMFLAMGMNKTKMLRLCEPIKT